MHAELRADGEKHGRKRVARLMRGAGLVGASRRRAGVIATRHGKEARPAPDLVDQDFTAAAPNQLWVADITFVPTTSGVLYLAVVLDAWSRKPDAECQSETVGWAMANHLRAELVVEALEMALGQRRPHNVILHSDQGCQYILRPRENPETSHLRNAVDIRVDSPVDFRVLTWTEYTLLAFGKRRKEAGARPSMGSVGDAYDNAMCESFFATLECEMLERRRFASQAEARMACFSFIEGWYNPVRLHSALSYRSPIAYETARSGALAHRPPRVSSRPTTRRWPTFRQRPCCSPPSAAPLRQ